MTDNMPAGRTPLVSVAIPLYRSRPFVDVIARNIEAIDYPSTEILISDRHQEDDALDILAARFAGNRRIRILRARDRLDWVDHYNLLLTAATGDTSSGCRTTIHTRAASSARSSSVWNGIRARCSPLAASMSSTRSNRHSGPTPAGRRVSSRARRGRQSRR